MKQKLIAFMAVPALVTFTLTAHSEDHPEGDHVILEADDPRQEQPVFADPREGRDDNNPPSE